MRLKTSEDEFDDTMDPSEFFDNADSLTETSLLENDMTAVKKTKDTTAKTPATEKKVKTVAPATKAAAPATDAKAKGVFGPREVPEGFTGLNTVAEQVGITPAAARRKLRGQTEIVKPEGQHGWYWKDGSKELAKVTKLLTPTAE